MLAFLLDTWDRWHLNHLRPECEHQRAEGWRDLAKEEATLYHWRLNSDAEKTVRDALKAAEVKLRAACDVCGYRYGSEWRREDVPAEIIEKLRAL